MLSLKRDLITARLFLRLALSTGGTPPRVINVDGHPAYASAIAELKQTGELGRPCRCRTTPYLNASISFTHLPNFGRRRRRLNLVRGTASLQSGHGRSSLVCYR